MKRTGTPKNNKYQTKEWQSLQAKALEEREALLPVLAKYGITYDDVNDFEILVKANKDDKYGYKYSGIKAFHDLNGLTHLHYIDSDKFNLSASVVKGLRGTILWQDKAVIRGPIRYTETATKMERTGDRTVFTGGKILGKISLKTSTLDFRFYNDGTVIDIFKANGVVHWVTPKNLVPEGVWPEVGDKPIHSPSRWAPWHIPFMDTFKAVAKAVDPNLLIGDVLFPRTTKFSNRVYRFFVSSPERMRADTTVCGPIGFMTYLGCLEQWPLEPQTEEDKEDLHHVRNYMGTPHTDDLVYHPRNMMSQIPTGEAALKPFIVDPKGFSYETGLDVLDHPSYLTHDEAARRGRHSGGGSLLVTGKKLSGEEVAIQVVSPSYEFRTAVMGTDSADLYAHFISRLDDALYDLTKPAEVKLFLEKNELLNVLAVSENLDRILDKIIKYEEIPPLSSDQLELLWKYCLRLIKKD